MKLKLLSLVGFLLCGGVSAYIWKVQHSNFKTLEDTVVPASDQLGKKSILVFIDEKPITTEDLDFEYSLHTKGLFDEEALKSVPDLGARFELELLPLKERLMSGLIERKVLYHFIQKDERFSIADPARFTACLDEWQKTVAVLKESSLAPSDSQRLKERFCEKSIITQYLDESIFPELKIEREEIAAYYEAHESEFKVPERVLIRQIVLASEKEAQRIRSGLTRQNFSERAKNFSITPEAENGGLIGPFSKGDMPHLFDVAFQMTKGSIFGIVKSTYGFHLILLEDKFKKTNVTLEQASEGIRKKLLQKKKEEVYQSWVENALNIAKVKISKVEM